MTSKILAAMVAIVVGLALLPVVNDFVTDLTGTGGALENTTTGSLVELLPVLFVLILVGGTIGYVYFSKKGN